ncbi:MAG: ComF family protein, partial [Phycisphaerae bacterium]
CDAHALCDRCAEQMACVVGGSYCSTCGEDRHPHLLIDGSCGACRLRKSKRPSFDRFIRVGRYTGPLRAMILRFKHEIILDELLGEMLADAVQSRIEPHEVDLWVPVPSHWVRRIRRRFQPTALLTSHTARRYGRRASPVLAMTRYVPQFHLNAIRSRPARARAIAGAFRLKRGVRLTGRSVCLIDDVTNTGATLAEAKRTLRAAGARRILAAVLANTSSFRESDTVRKDTVEA